MRTMKFTRCSFLVLCRAVMFALKLDDLRITKGPDALPIDQESSRSAEACTTPKCICISCLYSLLSYIHSQLTICGSRFTICREVYMPCTRALGSMHLNCSSVRNPTKRKLVLECIIISSAALAATRLRGVLMLALCPLYSSNSRQSDLPV